MKVVSKERLFVLHLLVLSLGCKSVSFDGRNTSRQGIDPISGTPLPSSPADPNDKTFDKGRVNDSSTFIDPEAPIIVFDDPSVTDDSSTVIDPKNPRDPSNPQPSTPPQKPLPPNGLLVATLTPEEKNIVWAVTTDGVATYMRLENDAVAETRKWTGVLGGKGGSRTFVTEKGIVVARSGGRLFWIDPNVTPQGNLNDAGPGHVHQIRGVSDSTRACIVSYRRDDDRFIGVAYGQGHFVEYAMSKSSPYAPIFTKITRSGKVSGEWGYSCYVDQKNLIFYSQMARMVSGKTFAIDLKNMKEVNAQQTAKNAKFTSKTHPDYSISTKPSPKEASYAIFGDLNGNVYNGKNVYTFSHEPSTDSLFISGGGKTLVMPRSCLTKTESCSTSDSLTIDGPTAPVGPLSSLGRGRIIGMQPRVGNVYLIKANDLSRITNGVTVTKIAELGENPYMYTDFTGGTLYLINSQNLFDLRKITNFRPNDPVQAIGFTWLDKKGANQPLVDIKMEARCFQSGTTPPNFVVWPNILPSAQQNIIKAVGCFDTKFDTVEVKLSQLNDKASLIDVEKIQLTIYQ